MGRGGPREGAGRKKGVGNLLTRELRERINPGPLIKYLHDVAEGKKKATIKERMEAATILLKKVLPDISRHEAELGIGGSPVPIIVHTHIPPGWGEE